MTRETPKLMQKFTDGAKIYEVVGIYYGPAIILRDQDGNKITTGVGGTKFQGMIPHTNQPHS
jgi:hypothetical protein